MSDGRCEAPFSARADVSGSNKRARFCASRRKCAQNFGVSRTLRLLAGKRRARVSDDECFRGLGGEEVGRLVATAGQPLLVVVLQEDVERLLVGRKTIGPVVVAEQLPGFLEVLDQPRLHEPKCRRVVDARIRFVTRGQERLVQRLRDPAMPFVDIAAQHHDVHDREDVGGGEVLLLDRDRRRRTAA